MPSDRPKMLIVDDDSGMRLTLEGIIEDEGYEVVSAADGYQALELAKQTPFALVFMDIRMPGMNGVDTYREIKKVNPGSVVVMMTGFSVEGLVKDALDEGAHAVIYKPFSMDQINDIVQKVLKTTCILIVDDRAASRDALRAILEDNNFTVFEVSDARQAISMASERHYDVMLMDIKMPGVEGPTAFKEIIAFDPTAQVDPIIRTAVRLK